MSIKTRIVDGLGSGRQAGVDSANRLMVSPAESTPPEVGQVNRYRFHSQLLSSNGDGTGTTNMNVDGSVTMQQFTVEANEDYDLRIMKVVVIIADNLVSHSNFGNVSALTNGIELHTNESGVITKIIEDAKTGGQVIAQSALGAPYGDAATAFELSNWSGTDDAQTIVVPIDEIVPNGLRIGRGSEDHVMMMVKDDLRGLAEFTCRVIGYRHYPD
jgi:hypothetical protein